MEKPSSDPASLTKNVQSRREQVAAWEASETSKASAKMKSQFRVKFRLETAFLAACSSSDFEEITRLLQDKKVDINTSNVDGLTALHQACIDNKLELVRFLCEHGANLHARDNEGWTPLHATAIGGHTEIAKYLIKRGASLAVANSDGDLPHDVAELTEMKNLLRNGLAALEESAARSAESDAMQRDAEVWLRDGRYRDVRDPVANAGPLHVAAAKGYQQALVTLLQCPGAPIEAVDSDGWTALHAAAHWGQEDACRTLVAHGASMDAVTNANQTVFDLADDSVKPLLTELKVKQKDLMQESHVRKRPGPSFATLKIEDGRGHTMRRSSVTRLPQSERHDITQKSAEQEKHPELLARNAGPGRSPLASTESLSSDDELRQQQQQQVQQSIPHMASMSSVSLASSTIAPLDQQRPSPSPPAFVVTELPPPSPPPRQHSPVIGVGGTVGSRRVEIIAASTSSAGASTPAATAPFASVPTASTYSTSAPAPDASSESVANRGGSKVRSILTRMESLQETSSSSSSSSTGSGPNNSSRQSQVLSGRGSTTGNQRVQSTIGILSVSSSGTLSAQLPFPKTEPTLSRVSQSQDFSVDRQSIAAPAKLLAVAAGTADLVSEQRNGGRISGSLPLPQPQANLVPPQQASSASRRVSVIMEKEKTDESETERRRISRHNRATKRLTQGVTPDDVEQAKKIMEARIATAVPSNADAVNTAPATPASLPETRTPVVLAAVSAMTGQRRNPDRSEAFTASDTNSSRLTRTRPDSYHGVLGPSPDLESNRLQDSGSGGRPASPIDYRKLYERERTRTDRLFEENSRMRQELDQLKTQQQQTVKVDKRLSNYEAQERAAQAESELNRLRLENSKLKADNTSLIRVISRLSSQPSST